MNVLKGVFTSSAVLALVSAINFSAACGTDLTKKDDRSHGKKGGAAGANLAANSGKKVPVGTSGWDVDQGGDQAVSSGKLEDPRFPKGNICTMARAKLEYAGILPYTGVINVIGIGKEGVEAAAAPTSVDAPPPAQTETVDGVVYTISFTTEASCTTKIRGKTFTFFGEQNSLALQEGLYNTMCLKGPLPKSPEKKGAAKKAVAANYSAKQFWSALESRQCAEIQAKHYFDQSGNEVFFGQDGGTVEPVKI